MRAVLSIQRKLLGEEHSDFLETLHGLGWMLEGEGNFAEAEIAYRGGVIGRQKRGEGETPQALSELEGLVRVLVAQNKFTEAEQQLGQTLTPAFVRQPASGNLLALRADLLGRQGRWSDAVADATLAVEHQPTEQYRYHTLAPLLVITGDRPAYEQLCRKMLPMFADTVNPYVAERVAKDCLLLPGVGVNLQLVNKLADKSVTLESGNDPMPYSQGAKALSEYRQGHFVEAINWAKKPLTSSEIYAQSHAYAILAMANLQLGQKDEARVKLAKGKTLAQTILPGRDANKIGGAWVAWLFSQIQLDEATALIQPAAPAENLPGKP
jgi:tetratricopeptide (TPR) repeat protein